jgi:protein-S-isoprenylcysteine O-methyltransferase Ste14
MILQRAVHRSGRFSMLALRSLLYTIALPGTVIVLIPYLIASAQGDRIPQPWGPLQVVGLVAALVGATILLRCIWEFMVTGRGTLAPVDPPTELVVRGLYRYVRNPMYLGAFTLMLGEAALFESVAVLLYAVAWFVIINLIVYFHEEPVLGRRFGDSYQRYTESVRRWVPSQPRDR